MKKWLAVFVIFIVILMVAVACHRGGGDEGPGPISGNEPIVPPPGPGPAPGIPDIVFSTPVQAASATAALSGTQALASAQFAVASALGVNAQPAGFAPSLSKSGDIGSVDPAVAKIVKTMKSFANSATIQRAVKKTAALRSQAMRATIPPPGTTLTTDACNAEGQVVISGENTYDDPTNPNINSKYDITFTNCKDSTDATQLDGTMHIEQLMSTDNDGVASTVNANGLTQITFADDTFAVKTLTSVMTGTFINDNQVTKISNFADGTFTVTTPATAAAAEKVATFGYAGLEEIQTETHNPDLTNTAVTTTKGTFKVTSATGGTTTLEMSLAMDLTDNTVSLNDAAGTRNNRLNGSVDMTFAPNPATAGCLSGKLNVTTVDTAPRTFTTAGGACPTNGTVKINTATINYEPTAPIQVDVGGGTPISYANCAELDAAGGACKF
jgi:hypothetical protein